LVNEISQDERKNVKLWAEAVHKKANLVKYTNELFDKIKRQEQKKVELWAEATRELSKEITDYTFALKVVSDNTTVPVILADEKRNPIASRNLDPAKENDINYLRQQMKEMEVLQTPIEITIYKNKKNYLFYKDSKLFSELKTMLDDLIKSFISEVAINSASVPVIYTDSTKSNILATGNIDSLKLKDTTFLKATLKSMAYENQPIEVEFGSVGKHYIFFQQSTLLTQLKYYPYVIFGIIGLFLLIAYLLFSTARKAEQNQVWVGMAKETAHQLGTPLSSLMAWVEYFKAKEMDEGLISEIEKDVKRLETITERFSKIGSVPKLETVDLIKTLTEISAYFKQRTSKNITIKIESNNSKEVKALLNIPLFEWAIENIYKNAADAMNGKGSIIAVVTEHTTTVTLDITDTGKGIPRSKLDTVFKAGFTTKNALMLSGAKPNARRSLK